MKSTGKTRPALRTENGGEDDRQTLWATLVFHPDFTRIGARAALLSWPAERWPSPRDKHAIGRAVPDFSDGLPIGDPHVSRRALTLSFKPAGLLISVASESADCRIGADRATEVLVDHAQLAVGVPVRLGHGVVILLRQAASAPAVYGTSIDEDAYPGTSEEVRQLRQLIFSAARSHLPVLVLGESGVGKELVAGAVHRFSPRADERLVAINMTAISEGLAAAELFGSTKGAFTGAQPRSGFFRDAHKGTLFLDEIGDTAPQIQTQLLRALQTGEVQVVGGRPEVVDVRIVAATDADTSAESGFRAALKHRLAGVTLEVPPLRSRLEDIGVIARGRLLSSEQGAALLAAAVEDPRVAAYWAGRFFDWLLERWPGNIRELINACDRELLDAAGRIQNGQWQIHEPTTDFVTDVGDDRLAEVHRASEFEVAATARALGMSRPTLYRRIRAHPDLRLADDISDDELRESVARWGRDERTLSRHLEVSASALKARLKSLKP
ncbi:sigma-54 dependent transcriptional regulator, Fis family [Luminiphilus syltensis NOR5-1B]|uniref:Sigma-54 dependent transcriptional regulator, Fis family n=1 Tax=Luminiphilus syltensis NOR5-1B TaxID=565045 RepID=B8KQN8_9GAMM|nr:sigma 54-interacting transcriptional regulator [Luminiphilus syltensis]EED35491.1 sigma-54 dependent transcriptional regulator, Fis family [Luminiphilus syltensis NOR5-1B]